MDRSSRIGVLTKIVAVLDEMAKVEGAIGFSDLASRLGIPRPTLHRLVGAMRAEGLVDVQGGRFVLGPRLVAWSSLAAQRSDLRALARPWLERLTSETGETAAVYVRVADQRICLDRVEGKGMLRPAIRIGESMPLHVGAAGHVILAWSDPLEWDALWQSSERNFPAEGPVDPPDWWALRGQGWVLSMRDRDDALSSVSVPVLDAQGRLVAAIDVSGPLSRLTREQLKKFVPRLQEAATALRQAIEASEPQPARGTRGAESPAGRDAALPEDAPQRRPWGQVGPPAPAWHRPHG